MFFRLTPQPRDLKDSPGSATLPAGVTGLHHFTQQPINLSRFFFEARGLSPEHGTCLALTIPEPAPASLPLLEALSSETMNELTIIPTNS